MYSKETRIEKNGIIPVYHQLFEILLDMINTGQLKVHDRLPSENELKDHYSISRYTAQRALKKLVDQGIAYRSQGMGTFVADKTITYSITALLSYSAEIVGLHKTTRSKLINAAEISADRLIASKLEIPEKRRIYMIQRIRYVDEMPMSIQTSFLSRELVPDLIRKEFKEDSLFKTIRKEYGHQVGKASESLKAVNANPLEKKIFKLRKNDAVFLLERVTRLKSGVVLEFAKTILRGDWSKFTVELSTNQNRGRKKFGR
jgi:GntR family transcriptional regulator